MKFSLKLLASFILLGAPSAQAASGVFNYGEVITVPSCPQVFLVATGNSFSIAQIVGGPEVADRDILVGDLQRIGLTTAENTSRDNEQITLIVLEILLSRTQYGSYLARYCNR